jgi:hypothetical protein
MFFASVGCADICYHENVTASPTLSKGRYESTVPDNSFDVYSNFAESETSPEDLVQSLVMDIQEELEANRLTGIDDTLLVVQTLTEVVSWCLLQLW